MFHPQSQFRGHRRTKIIWSPTEKKTLVNTAIDIQKERPDLSGLSLLRAAVKVLPEGRRRRIIALSQVPWFEPGLATEVQRRAAEAQRESGIPSILERGNTQVGDWRISSDAWRAKAMKLLALILAELREIKLKLK